MTERKLGVCYYPEHWPESEWPAHAAAMAANGISLVRIGEFAWSRIEPSEGQFDWAWLDRAVQVLSDAGLSIVMGTPSACPPHWLIDRYPDVMPVGEDGRARGFGSRRHYSFSSDRYRELAADISRHMATRYGAHEAVVAWQLDNEYGCHDTTLCYSDNALAAFHEWLAEHYESVDALNEEWGNVFWSQEYRRFSDVGLPVAVTECNPSHRLAFRRFCSDQVRRFNLAMLEAIRPHCHDAAWFTHNFMGNFTDFDHFDAMDGLDVASWDSYPLGFLDISWMSDTDKTRYRRGGHPDWASFHHSLYRATGRGRFGVMEQQPGPVNWARNNAEPYPGMVRLWAWEAFATGAEFVSVFRWRQAPFAQEQMHAGMQYWDGATAPASVEMRQVADELSLVAGAEAGVAPVALVFDYPSVWSLEIQPHQVAQSALRTAFEYYSTVRSLGIDVDIVKPGESLKPYQVVLAPALTMLTESARQAFADTDAFCVYGPRFASRTPGHQQHHERTPFPIAVRAVDGIRPGVELGLSNNPANWYVCNWLETLDTELAAEFHVADGRGVIYRDKKNTYINAGLSEALLRHVLSDTMKSAGLNVQRLNVGLRYQRCGEITFAFNYGPDDAELPATRLLFGESRLSPGGVAAWRS